MASNCSGRSAVSCCARSPAVSGSGEGIGSVVRLGEVVGAACSGSDPVHPVNPSALTSTNAVIARISITPLYEDAWPGWAVPSEGSAQGPR